MLEWLIAAGAGALILLMAWYGPDKVALVIFAPVAMVLIAIGVVLVAVLFFIGGVVVGMGALAFLGLNYVFNRAEEIETKLRKR